MTKHQKAKERRQIATWLHEAVKAWKMCQELRGVNFTLCQNMCYATYWDDEGKLNIVSDVSGL